MDLSWKDALSSVKPLDLRSYKPNDWTNWYSQYKLLSRAVSLEEQPNSKKVAILMVKLGNDMLTVFRTFGVDEDNVNYGHLVELFTQYFYPINSRQVFFKQHQGANETFEQFADRLSILSCPCLFGPAQGSIVRDIFVANMHDRYAELRREICKKPDPLLQEILNSANRWLNSNSIHALVVPDSTSRRSSISSTCGDESHKYNGNNTHEYSPSAKLPSTKPPTPSCGPLNDSSVQSAKSPSSQLSQIASNGGSPHTRPQKTSSNPVGNVNRRTPPPNNVTPQNQSNVSPRSANLAFDLPQVTVGCTIRVVVLHIPNHKTYYIVSPVDYRSKRKEFMEKLQLAVGDRPPKQVSTHHVYALKSDDQWCRARVAHFADDKARMCFIDHGYFRNNVEASLLRELPNPFKELPGLPLWVKFSEPLPCDLAVDQEITIKLLADDPQQKCWHVRLVDETGSAPPNKLYAARNSGRQETPLVEKQFGRKTQPRTSVESPKPEETTQNGRRETMQSRNSGSQRSDEFVRTNNKQVTESKPGTPIPKGQFVGVKVVHITDDGKTFVCPLSSKSQFCQLSALVNKTYSDPSANKVAENPVVGSQYAATFDGDIYRVQVLAINVPKQLAKVFYYDYGNISKIKLSELVVLPGELKAFPCVTFPIRLPVGVKAEDNDDLIVRLGSLEDDGVVWEVDVKTGDEIVKYSKVSKELPDDTPLRPPQPLPIPKNEFTPVTVVYNGPEGIYVIPNNKKDHLAAVLATISTKTNTTSRVPKPEVGQVLIAPFEGDLYRAKVLTVDLKQSTCRVLFVDFGNECVLQSDCMHPLPEGLSPECHTLQVSFKPQSSATSALEGQVLSISPVGLEPDGSCRVQLEGEVSNQLPREDGFIKFKKV